VSAAVAQAQAQEAALATIINGLNTLQTSMNVSYCKLALLLLADRYIVKHVSSLVFLALLLMPPVTNSCNRYHLPQSMKHYATLQARFDQMDAKLSAQQATIDGVVERLSILEQRNPGNPRSS
jgi:hypothetical protein